MLLCAREFLAIFELTWWEGVTVLLQQRERPLLQIEIHVTLLLHFLCLRRGQRCMPRTIRRQNWAWGSPSRNRGCRAE
jgi:hypothetical protein